MPVGIKLGAKTTSTTTGSISAQINTQLSDQEGSSTEFSFVLPIFLVMASIGIGAVAFFVQRRSTRRRNTGTSAPPLTTLRTTEQMRSTQTSSSVTRACTKGYEKVRSQTKDSALFPVVFLDNDGDDDNVKNGDVVEQEDMPEQEELMTNAISISQQQKKWAKKLEIIKDEYGKVKSDEAYESSPFPVSLVNDINQHDDDETMEDEVPQMMNATSAIGTNMGGSTGDENMCGKSPPLVENMSSYVSPDANDKQDEAAI